MYDPGPGAADPFAQPTPRPAPDPDDPFSQSVVRRAESEAPAAPPAPPAAQRPPASPRTVVTPRADGRSHAPVRGVLVVYATPDGPGQLYPVREGRNVIGRGEGCDVALDDGEVSGQHAFLFVGPDRVNFMDVSRNGSLVDGRLVHGDQATLVHGTVLRLGGKVAVYVEVPAVGADAWGGSR